MDFVTHLPRTSCRHDAVWVIVYRLTKSAHFLAMQMTFTLEEFCELYIYERLLGYMEYRYPSYRTEIPGSRHTFGRVSKRPWGYS